MQKLPQEIVNTIVDCLYEISDSLDQDDAGPRVASLATVSRPWQHAIESHTLRHLRVKSPDLDKFASFLSSASTPRLSLVQILEFDVILPAYSDDVCGDYETDHDRTINSQVASQCVSALLEIMSNSRWSTNNRLRLRINIYSPMDGSHRGRDKLDKDRYAVNMGNRKDIFQDRYRYSYISLSDTNYSVPCVTSLTPPQGTTRYLDPRSLVALTATFPRLESILWSYQEPGYFFTLRRQYLRDFSDALSGYRLPSTLKTLHIDIEAPDYPHSEKLPNLVEHDHSSTAHGSKSFCDALRVMIGESQSLNTFRYSGPVDPALLWNDCDTDEGVMGTAAIGSLTWTVIEDFSIFFDPASFSGQWYFKGLPEDQFYNETLDSPLPYDADGLEPPGYDEENTEAAIALVESMGPLEDEDGFLVEESIFRRIPREEAFIPLLKAFARRLATMPHLKRALMESRLGQEGGDWFICYDAPGLKSGYEEFMEDPEGDDLSRARIFIHPADWRPGEEVERLLKDVGKACHGQDSILTFLPFGLV